MHVNFFIISIIKVKVTPHERFDRNSQKRDVRTRLSESEESDELQRTIKWEYLGYLWSKRMSSQTVNFHGLSFENDRIRSSSEDNNTNSIRIASIVGKERGRAVTTDVLSKDPVGRIRYHSAIHDTPIGRANLTLNMTAIKVSRLSA